MITLQIKYLTFCNKKKRLKKKLELIVIDSLLLNSCL